MPAPFNTSLPDGTPAPRFDMTNVRAAEHQIAVTNETAANQAAVLVEERRLAEASQRHADIIRGEQELAYLRQQNREAHRANGDDGPDRLRAQFLAAVRQQAESAGLEFVEPVEEPIQAPEPINLRQGSYGPSLDGDLFDVRQRFEAAVLRGNGD